jgi:hypothetical protein
MKHIKRIAVVTALALSAILVFAACGGGVTGTYKPQEITIKSAGLALLPGYDAETGLVIDLTSDEEVDSTVKTMVTAYKNMSIEVTKDEIIVTGAADAAVSETVKYKMDGNKVVFLDDDGNPVENASIGEVTIKGGVLTITSSVSQLSMEIKITFKK